MVSRCFFLLFGVALVAAGAPAASSFGQTAGKSNSQRLILLDGSPVQFQSLEINAERVTGAGIPTNLTLDDLRSIQLPDTVQSGSVKSSLVVELRGGGRLLATAVTIADEKCRLEWSGGDPLLLAIDLVRAVRFNPATPSADFDKATAAPSAEFDRVFLKDDGGKVSSVTGLLDSLDSEQLKISVGGQDHAISRTRLLGIVVAQPAAGGSPARCLVTFRDGSLLGGETLSVTGDKAILVLPAGGKAALAWSAVARVTISSKRVSFLSDMKPATEVQQPIVTLPLAAQRDKSVSGKPLSLGTRTFEKGLGVHARSSLTFAADKKWDVLAATIGLDVETGGKGDCVFVVLADGEPLLTRRMKGNDPPADIQLPITGRAQVTLVVEPGEALDLADHADWCDARFIKNRE